VSIYRYYKKAGTAGVLLAIFYLADVLSAYEDTISEERWGKAMKDSRMLLDSWFNHYGDYVSPPVLIDGDEIMAELNLRPGRAIGETLELVREAEVRGEINNKNEALRFIHALSIHKEGSIK
jgi:poly(A) polymerase/tRNA nucleotidyltransferase (CCA-adding enzyme)